MSYLPTDPDRFAERAIDGFAASHPRHVQRVDGGVIRLAPMAPGQVAVVAGGGSGHYPAFAGLVGAGMAAAAACGNIFAAPSAGQVLRVGSKVDQGGGLLLICCNYAGDVLHFSLGAERLRRQGIEARLVTVTDDIASASADQLEQRRGTAGSLAVYKVAGAAAEAGLPLDAVEHLARKANAHTRTLGVAFSGCTLPGATDPLFTLPSGSMAIGMGLHGEPGLSEGPLCDADSLAALLVERLLQERPPQVAAEGQRVVALLNGLGGFKYEELFVLFQAISEQLGQAGVAVADCECGELVTSLDMAGVSLSLFWLDAELEPFWTAPADSPAYRRGGFSQAVTPLQSTNASPNSRHSVASHAAAESESASAPFTDAQRTLLARFAAVEAVLSERKEELGALDAVAGDGDHGLGMLRGIRGACVAAQSALARNCGTGEVLMEAGEAWSDHGGGTSGALWGGALLAAGQRLALMPDKPVDQQVTAAVDAALQAVRSLGQASVGDKTMLDALEPFHCRLHSNLQLGMELEAALEAAAEASLQAARATADLLPKRGRARPHGERSLGHPDPGAMSLAYCLNAALRPRLDPPNS